MYNNIKWIPDISRTADSGMTLSRQPGFSETGKISVFSENQWFKYLLIF